jgi:hypothetical protein
VCPTQVEDLDARVDHAAVHVADVERLELAGDHRDHHFVEEREALGHLPLPDQRATHALPGERNQIGVTEALSRGERLGEQLESPHRIPRPYRVNRFRHQEVSAHRAVERGVVERASCAREPAAGERGLTSQEQPHPDAEGASRRSLRVTSLLELLVRTRPQVRAGRLVAKEEAQVARRSRSSAERGNLAVGTGQQLVCFSPCLRSKQARPCSSASAVTIDFPLLSTFIEPTTKPSSDEWTHSRPVHRRISLKDTPASRHT